VNKSNEARASKLKSKQKQRLKAIMETVFKTRNKCGSSVRFLSDHPDNFLNPYHNTFG